MPRRHSGHQPPEVHQRREYGFTDPISCGTPDSRAISISVRRLAKSSSFPSRASAHQYLRIALSSRRNAVSRAWSASSVLLRRAASLTGTVNVDANRISVSSSATSIQPMAPARQ